MDRTRREVLKGAVAVAAAAPLPVAKGVDLGLGEFGPEKYFISCWGEVNSTPSRTCGGRLRRNGPPIRRPVGSTREVLLLIALTPFAPASRCVRGSRDSPRRARPLPPPQVCAPRSRYNLKCSCGELFCRPSRDGASGAF